MINIENPNICIVIPILNELKTIKILIESIEKMKNLYKLALLLLMMEVQKEP